MTHNPQMLASAAAAVLGHLHSTTPAETHRLGVLLGRLLVPGQVVGLVGELGAGKTALCAGVAEGMDVAEETYVSSPTFTLVNEYPGRFTLVHVDLYRVSDPRDLWEIGLDDYYRAPVACVVEWFDRFPDLAPAEHLLVQFGVGGEEDRLLTLRAVGRLHQELGRRWAADAVKA